VLKRLIHAVLLILTLAVGATAAVVIVSQTAWFKDWLRGYIVREADRYLNGNLSIGRLGGNLFYGIELENVGVSMDGREVVAVQDVGLQYNLFQLLASGLSIDEVRLNHPIIYLRRDGDTWSIAHLIKKQAKEADREGPTPPITVDAIGISDASVVFEQPVATSGVEVPRRIEDLDARLSFKYEPVHYSIEISHLSFSASEPAFGLRALSGGVAVRDDTFYIDKLALRTQETSLSVDGAVKDYLTKPILNLRVSSDKVSIDELSALVPALADIHVQPAFEMNVAGPTDELAVDMNVRSSAGDVKASVVTDFLAPGQSVRGDIAIRRLNVAAFIPGQQRSDLTADARVDLRADSFVNPETIHGSVSLTAPRVRAAGYTAERIRGSARIDGRRIRVNGRATAYGADLTTEGRVVLQSRTRPTSYDLRGRVQRLDLRRLPATLRVPPADTDVTADYHVRGVEPPARAGAPRSLDGEFRFAESAIAGARVEDGSTASISMRNGGFSYTADARLTDLDLERLGRTFNLPALANERYRSRLNADVTATGNGTDPKALDITAKGTLTDSSILDGRLPSLSFDVAFADDEARVRAAGSFEDFDPAVLSGRAAAKGSITGALDVDATIAMVSAGLAPERIRASGTASLDRSTIGGVAIDRASLDADYHDNAGDIRKLEIAGRDVNVSASGSLALNETGQSKLTFHADTPSLEEVAALFNVPASGIAQADGTLTGNRRQLRAEGKLVASNVKYQEHGALSASSTFSVQVPDLAFDRAEITAETDAAFVTVAGQNINEVSAKTTYAGKRLAFDGEATQGERTLGLAGDLLLHPDHQEVHVQRLNLDTRGTVWQLEPGSEATFQYGPDAIEVENARLVSGDQRITANGTFGRPGDALQVEVANVDLASIDALLLRAPQFTGRLNARASVSGSRRAPEADGEFAITSGGFRNFKYDTFGGTARYSGKGLTVDTRLQQNPQHWISAKGYIPAALFSRPSTPPRTETPHVAVVAPEDQIDLLVDSSPIDLGIVQGFTTALTDVTGTLEAHLRVTGSADDPHPTGVVTIDKGFAEVVPVGVRYRNITGRIDLEPDRVHIDRITLVDNQESELTVSGDLAIHEREVGGVQIRVQSDDFKVIDNNLGNVRLRSQIEISGELRAPRVNGFVGVTTGVINIDEILALTDTSAYSTTPTEFLTRPDAGAGDSQPEDSGPLFDRLQMNVHLTIPDDLVVKASNLQTPNAPIGLGALNVTLGGDLTVTKEPGERVGLVGSVNTVRGNYDFQGRRFEILRDGTVRFQGLDEINPRLDIRTRRIIQAVEARVGIRGTMRQPEIQLSSTPPLEEADILSLIVFNQPINQLGTGEQISLVARAQSLAAGALAGEIARSIGGALNLNTFEINLAPESGAGPEVTVGQQVGANLFVRIQQGLGDQSSTNLILEYELTDWLRFRSNLVQGTSTQQTLFRRAESTGGDLIFFLSY
jgi:autotransporter translocation and assembly factor TamB